MEIETLKNRDNNQNKTLFKCYWIKHNKNWNDPCIMLHSLSPFPITQQIDAHRRQLRIRKFTEMPLIGI